MMIAGAALAQGQPDPYTDHPEPLPGPAGPAARALLAAFGGGGVEGFLRFLDEHATEGFRRGVSDEEHRGFFRDVYGQTRGVEYVGYRTYDPPRPDTEHVIVVRDRLAGGWHAFVLAMDPAQPARIAGMRLAPARPPSTLPPPGPLTLPQAMAELDAHIDRLAAADAFAGAILVARNGRPIYERAAGLASRSFNVPNDMDTRFNLGSMNKMFTAVAVARLVEQGKLSFDDTIDRWVSEAWLPRDMTQRIRVRHLLNHTSGLGSYFNDEFFKSSRALYRALDDYQPLIRGETLAFEPGSDWSYSNTGFFLAGVVIEAVSGESYFDHVRRHIFEPAGMTGTDSYEMDRPVPNLAIGYIPEFDDQGRASWRNNLYMHVIKGGPAGGGFSTVRDLLRFDTALRAGRLVSQAMLEELWRARPEAGSPDYGYGFGIEQGPLGRVVGHGGGFPGLNGQLDMYLDSGYTVAVLSNVDGGAGPVARTIAQLLARVAEAGAGR
jgi:CubicO group peptidase (beta-lactamase class C family)